MADHVIDAPRDHYIQAGVSPLHDAPEFNPYLVKEGDLIFVKTDFIVNGYFTREVLPKIFTRFRLITGVSSYNIGRDGGDIYRTVLDHPALIKWYCTNPPNVEDDKIVPLPIGFEEPDRLGGNQEMLERILTKRTAREDKSDKILLPYHDVSTNPERAALYQRMKSLPFVDAQEEKLPVEEYLKLLDRYKFVICLEGRGPDTHRNYEAMLVGAVPINKSNVIKKVFDYYNASAEFMDSWEDLDEKFYQKICEKNYDIDNNDKFLLLRNYYSLMGR